MVQQSRSDPKSRATERKTIRKAHEKFESHYAGLNNLCALFRLQMGRAYKYRMHSGFYGEIDHVENRAIAWMKEIREVDEKRRELEPWL
ncbi:MAG: hypothetical protein Q9168_004335 [Polycauliona sp. 1 TL-2023]